MYQIQSAPGAIDECSQRDSGDTFHAATAAARYTLWTEAASVDGPGPSAQTAPVLCVAGCRNEVPPVRMSHPLDAAAF